MATTYDGSIRINTKIDQTGVASGLSTLKNSLKSFATAVGVTFSVSAVVDFIKTSVELASNLNEVQNVVDTTFGSASSEINAFAKTAAEKFGLSELAAKQYTGTMGAMLKSMGFSTDAAANMSTSIAGLSGDMASFYNLDTDEAFEKIRSGISGETEPLKQLGINLSESNLSAYALSQGLTTAYSAMSEQSKALLRYNYLMSITSDAQGDFAKTSASWANQVRVLKLQWDSLKATMGQAFIVALTPALQSLNQFIEDLNSATKKIMDLLGVQYADYSSTADSASDAASSVSDLADATTDAAEAAKGAVAGFDKLNILSSDTASTASASADTLGETSSGTSAYDDSSTKQGVSNGLDDIRTLFYGWALIALGAILTFFGHPFLGIAIMALGAIDVIVEAIENDQIRGFLTTALGATAGVLVGAALVALGALACVFGQVPLGVALIIMGAADIVTVAVLNNDAIKDFLTDPMNAAYTVCVGIALIVLGIMICLAEMWPLGIGFIVAGAAAIATVVVLNWNAITDALRSIDPAIALLVGAALVVIGILLCFVALPIGIGCILAGVAAIATEFALNPDGAKQAVKDILADIIAIGSVSLMALGLIVCLSGAGLPLGIGLIIAGIKGMGLASSISNTGLVQKIKDTINSIIDLFERGINFIIDKLNTLSWKVPDWVPGIGGNTWGFNIPCANLPRLAAGAVIPPNREFMAVLGDQKTGTNIEAPLETIKEAVRAVLAELGGTSQQSGDVNVYVGNEQFKAYIVRTVNAELSRNNA